MANYNIPPTSRYYGLMVLKLNASSDHAIAYLARRFVPPADVFTLLRTHTAVEGERMDLIAARELGDPGAFWRICDANDAMRPDDLTAVPGRTLRIGLPKGVPGPATLR
ncbi:LysM domain-containing protein [Bradyrhizobium sp. Arg816]|uniref:LysM domain-containing protein n=1 Tax=Bradyrhizobium sp. Arg816 TaxID=2998491 RepID=UPI00249F4617|nr:LysM domain-containing protein [Bradyrhizobium sp. Arg816]MDI3560163.1 LysM domain-containing protein [Bradyrhizobium sp. Arg816]